MEAPILQVIVKKGPKLGENLPCKPGVATRFGRVVKGNHFALRDPGISQNHFLLEYIPEESSWFVTDLDSSNGTSVNGLLIKPLVPFLVSDGDSIKIGDKTELLLKIEQAKGFQETEKRVSRRIRSKILKAREEPNKEEIRVSKSQHSNDISVLDEEGEDNESSKPDSDSGAIEEAKEAEPRVLRGRRRKEGDNEVKVLHEENKKNETYLNPDLGLNIEALEIGQKRRGRGQKNYVIENSTNILEEKEVIRDTVAISCSENVEPDINNEARLRRNPRRGKSSSRVLKDLDGNSQRKRIGRGRPKSVRVPEEQIETENQDSDSIKQKIVDSSSSRVVDENEAKEGEEKNKEEMEVDFENMTLDQWFDRMELFLQKVVHDEAEENINILRAKAQKFEEFLQTGDDHAD